MPRQKMPIDRWWAFNESINGLPNATPDEADAVSPAIRTMSENFSRKVVEAALRLDLDVNKLIQAHKRFIAATTPMGHDSAMEEGLNS